MIIKKFRSIYQDSNNLANYAKKNNVKLLLEKQCCYKKKSF